MVEHPPRLELAMTPTPLMRLPDSLGPPGGELWVKRDDMTGSVLSGNKARKLEFLLAEARSRGADTVITCGGEQTNHGRATAIAARQLGMDSALLLRTEDPAHPPPPRGNLLLSRLVGAQVHWIDRVEWQARNARMEAIASDLRQAGRHPYVIPEGGSNALGAWGYIRCVGELSHQLPEGPATLVYACGSGGTGAGLLLGIQLLGLPWRAVGVNVCNDQSYFVRVIGSIVEEARSTYRLPVSVPPASIEIRDGHVGAGYAVSRPEERALAADLARRTGLVLDPVYTGKAFQGLRQELTRDPEAFGHRVVFLHTGGVFGLFVREEELTAHL